MISICKYCGGTAPEGTDICRNCAALLKIADSAISGSDPMDSNDKPQSRAEGTDPTALSKNRDELLMKKELTGEGTAEAKENITEGGAFVNNDISAPSVIDADELASLAGFISEETEDSDESKSASSDDPESDQQREELSILAELSEITHNSDDEDTGDAITDEPIVIVPPVINELFTLSYEDEPVPEKPPVQSEITEPSGETYASAVNEITESKPIPTAKAEEDSSEITGEQTDAQGSNTIREITEERPIISAENEIDNTLTAEETEDIKYPEEIYISEETANEAGENPPDISADIAETLPQDTPPPTESETCEKEKLSPVWTDPQAELITGEWNSHNNDANSEVLWEAPVAEILKNPWSTPKADIIPAELLEAAGLTAKEIASDTEAAKENASEKDKTNKLSETVSALLRSLRVILKKSASLIVAAGSAIKKAVRITFAALSFSAKKTAKIACSVCRTLKKAAFATGRFIIGRAHDETIFTEHIGMRETAICCAAYLPFMSPIPAILMPGSKFMRYHSICGSAITVIIVAIQFISILICRILESVFTVTVNAGTSFEHTALTHGGFTLIAYTETALLILIAVIFVHSLTMAIFHRKNAIMPTAFYRLAEFGMKSAEPSSEQIKSEEGNKGSPVISDETDEISTDSDSSAEQTGEQSPVPTEGELSNTVITDGADVSPETASEEKTEELQPL